MKHSRQVTRSEMKVFGEKFRLMRESADMTLSELATEINTHRTMLGRWENGQCIPHEDLWEIEDRIKKVVEKRILSDKYLYKKYQFIHKLYSKIG